MLGESNGTPLQCSCLENPMDRGAWWATVHGVAKSWTRLSDSTFTFHFHALEKEMATHSSVLAWRIPGTAGPDGVAQSRTRLKRLSSSSSSVYMSVVLSISLSSFPLFVHKFILYICISIPALQIGSLIPFFLDSIYMHNIQYLLFLLTSFTLYNRF